jgi:hypothetical protein
MGIAAAIKSFVFGKPLPVLYDKFMFTADQREMIDKVKYMFDGTNIQFITYKWVLLEDGTKGSNVGVFQKDEEFVIGCHTDNQNYEQLTFTEPWDDEQHGEEGKTRVTASGLNWNQTIRGVEAVLKSYWDICDFYPIDLEAGQELQFNDQYYWIASK